MNENSLFKLQNVKSHGNANNQKMWGVKKNVCKRYARVRTATAPGPVWELLSGDSNILKNKNVRGRNDWSQGKEKSHMKFNLKDRNVNVEAITYY